MTIEPLLVGLGGAVGAVGRYAVGRALEDWQFPFPTLVVNVVGSFVLGFVVALGAADRPLALVGVGFCGAFTTYATFSVDAVRLWDRSRTAALGYAAGMLAACLLAVAVATGLAALAG
jgi:CrcB protein